MSFPLPSKYQFAIIHFELFCYEIKEEYSAIWNLRNEGSHIQSGRRPQTFQRNMNVDNDNLNLMDIPWNIFSDDLFHCLSNTGVTFECRLNVLSIFPRNYSSSGYNL